MAHLIDTSKGKPAFIAFQAPGWHNLGEVFKTEISTADALHRAGLDFQVLKLPNVHCIPQENGSLLEIVSESSFFTYRTDVNKILGDKLGRTYEVLQNAEALNIVDEILQAGTATIETAGSIDNGKRVFICLRIKKDIIVGDSDQVKQFILIANGHDGGTAITATPTNIRVVCNNTLTAALNGATEAIKIRHTAGAEDRLREAAKILKLIATNTEVNTENYNAMKAISITPEQMFSYFGNVFCTPEEIKAFQEGKKYKEVLSAQKQNVFAKVNQFATRGQGQHLALNGKDGLNMWFAYNAVTGYITGKQYSSVNDRAKSMLFGSAAETIHDAGVLALTPEKIKPLHKTNFSNLNFN